MFGRLFLPSFGLREFCNNSGYYNSNINRWISRLQFIHHCPVNSFPTNPTSIGMRVPRNPPFCIIRFFSRSEVFSFTNFLKQCLCRFSLSFSSSLIGILPCNIYCGRSREYNGRVPFLPHLLYGYIFVHHAYLY